MSEPLRADARRNRERLINAARAEFGARGVGVSLDEIAHAAGVGAGTLHRHFPTKRELIAAILADDLANVVRFAEELARSERDGGVYDVIDRLLDLAATNRALKDVVADAEVRESAVDRLLERLWAALQDLVGQAHRAGSLREDVTFAHTRQLLAALISVDKDATASDGKGLRQIVYRGMGRG